MKTVFVFCVIYAFWLAGSSSNADERVQGLEKLTPEDIYIGLATGDIDWNKEVEKKLLAEWSTGQVPMVLEYARFFRKNGVSRALLEVMRKGTGKNFDGNGDRWRQWLWAQEYESLPRYAEFKAKLYELVDPKFADYFVKTDNATIRLDEVRWGGVKQDGIPPLRNPKMLRAPEAKYLGEHDIVFGIEVDGEARAYPKRILAWHEMFTDTIGGVPLAGVY